MAKTLLVCLLLAALSAQAAVVPGDVNGDQSVSMTDVVYLVQYIFAGGKAPVDQYKHIDGAIDLRWECNNDSSVVGLQFRWDTDSNAVAQWDSAGIILSDCGSDIWPFRPGASDGATVKGLDSGTVYFVALKTVDSLGVWSKPSPIIRVQAGGVR